MINNLIKIQGKNKGNYDVKKYKEKNQLLLFLCINFY